jgi:hypothetical protein
MAEKSGFLTVRFQALTDKVPFDHVPLVTGTSLVKQAFPRLWPEKNK